MKELQIKEACKQDYIKKNIEQINDKNYQAIERKVRQQEMQMRILEAKGRREVMEHE